MLSKIFKVKYAQKAMLRGEIVAFNYYHPSKGKIEGTRSIPYYSIKRNYFDQLDS
jgi:hypothetical protein